MSGQIPKYGTHFRLDHVIRDFDRDLASAVYVSKRIAQWSVRGNWNSEHWFILLDAGTDSQRVIAGPFPTFTEASNRLVMALWELYGAEDEPMPSPIGGKRNRP